MVHICWLGEVGSCQQLPADRSSTQNDIQHSVVHHTDTRLSTRLVQAVLRCSTRGAVLSLLLCSDDDDDNDKHKDGRATKVNDDHRTAMTPR